MALIDDLKEAFPWLTQIGLDVQWLQNLASRAASSAEVVAEIRSTPQWRQRFPGIFDDRGAMVMNEAQYVQQERSYRSLLTQYGFDVDTEFKSPQSLTGFFSSALAPDELRDRLEIYRSVEEGSEDVKDAFFVYAGINLQTEDLYEAIISPSAEQRLVSEYNAAIAGGSMDYKQWISRATQLGATKVASSLERLRQQGALSKANVQKVLSASLPNMQSLMDAIWTGGTGKVPADPMSLKDLLNAFEFAAVGAAATSAGLEMPTLERLQQIRSAGVERTKMLSGYQQYGVNRSIYQSAVKRARGVEFGQSQFEAAAFLQDPTQVRNLEAGLASEEAAGKGSGTFRFEEIGGRIAQSGLRPDS